MSDDELLLIVRFQGQQVQRMPILENVLTIGRTPDNGLSLPHPQVARRHAELRIEGRQVVLIDLGSSSGTLVGETRLLPNQPQFVPEGAAFRIGPFELRYQAAGAAEMAPAAEPAPAEPEAPTARPAAPPRATFPAPRPLGPLSRYLEHLPAIYQDSSFLGRFLLLIEAIWEPLEQRQDHIEMYFDPRTCPAAMLPWLASWLDLHLDPYWPESRQRAVLSQALDLLRWRGTRYGLARIIELATGLTPEISDEPGQPHVMRVRVAAPADYAVDAQLLEALVQQHKPAHIGYILEVR